jgi:hypothetical protein
MLKVDARVGRIFVLAMVPILIPVFGAPSSERPSPPRGDRLPKAGDEPVRAVTVEERSANTSTLSRVPAAQ